MTTAHVRAAMRAVTRRMVEGATYEELTETLDALAAMPGAVDLRTEIAGHRLALLNVYHRDEAERERVLRAAMPALETLSPAERARWIVGACVGHLALSERYLPPLVPALESAGHEQVTEILRDHLEHERRRARPSQRRARPTPPSAVTYPPHLKAGLEVVRWLIVGRRPYEEIMEALDEVLALPGGEVAAGRVATERAALVGDQDDAEAERVIERIMPVLDTFSVQDRASTISLVCSGRPALAEKYMPPLIAELEDELRQRPATIGEKMLAGIKRSLERTRAGLPRP